MNQKSTDDYISPEDRKHLISELHRKQISQKEKEDFMELVHLLEAKEKQDEETLHRANLTREEAKRLFHESASLIRAIMDLKECESGRVKLKGSGEDIKKKIDDAKRWLSFLKTVGKK